MRETSHLTNDHRRLLGVAIAMAAADGVLEPSERQFLDFLVEQCQLVGEAREEVATMAKNPPSPEAINRWCVTESDRLDIYRLAVRMAKVDGRVTREETALLDRLARVLGLTSEQVIAATNTVKETLNHE